MKQINNRCPLQSECGKKKCEYAHHERDCRYYQGNARPGAEIEDQTQAMEAEWENRMSTPSVLSDKSNPSAPQETVSAGATTGNGSLVLLPVERLHPHPANPRKDLGDLTELAESIRGNGIYQNLTVVPLVDVDPDVTVEMGDDHYTVIIGHRRLAAAKLAGLAEVPCVVTSMTDKEQVQTMLMENMQRSDLTVYEQAQGFQMMLDLGSTLEEISEKSGFSKATVRRRLKMAELDQEKLKEVSSRQLSLGDFDTLAQIEDIKERNKVLETIGTRDFDYRVQQAITKQKERHNQPLVKKWLKDVGAEKLNENDAYSSRYESYDGRYSISVSKWGEKGSEPPKVGKEPIFYILTKYGDLRLFKKSKKKKEKKSPAEKAKEAAVHDAWAKLDATAAASYDLREKFISQLTVTDKNRQAIISGAVTAAILGAICYNSPDSTALGKIFNLANGYDEKRDEKVGAGLKEMNDKTLPKLVYALFGDGEYKCINRNYRGGFPEYEQNVKLELIYAWLTTLGYEMSTEEMLLLNGEHEGYHAKEAFDATA